MKTFSHSAALFFLFTLMTAAIATADDVNSDKKSFEVSDKSFGCLSDMTPVRGFFVDNLSGNIVETLAVANSEAGGKYPPGSVVQLVPGEVMVKHGENFNAATNDWEFFELEVSKEGSKIAKRGFVDVINKFGGNCFGCHVKADKQWDLVCETGHGCDPLPLTKEMLIVIQKTDPRCEGIELTDAEKELALKLKQLLN